MEILSIRSSQNLQDEYTIDLGFHEILAEIFLFPFLEQICSTYILCFYYLLAELVLELTDICIYSREFHNENFMGMAQCMIFVAVTLSYTVADPGFPVGVGGGGWTY